MKTGVPAYLYSYRKLSGRIGAALLGTAVLVGIATIRRTSEVSVVTAVPTQTEITQAAAPTEIIQAPKTEAAVASKPVKERITGPTIPRAPLIGETAPLVGEFGFATSSPGPPAIAEAPRPSPEPTTTQKESFEIAVQLTIHDGRVAEAQVGNRQPGAEAFEATALHLARQRRYPPGTSRTETVVVRVANQLGRKEP